ncbi:MAG: hypothetical protein ACOYWZ_01905 [Bacillota bacterium]
MIENCFECSEKAVPYKYIRRHIKLILNDNDLYEVFLNRFIQYFLEINLSATSREWAQQLLNGYTLDTVKQKHLKNSFSRVFTNDNHFKGLVGEYILSFYYKYIYNEFLWNYGPKPRSSAEPGIDYIVFIGQEDRLESIKFIVWETKTTQNNASSRASQIYRFFSVDGSFDENIDSEIHAIQEKFEDKEDSNLKQVVSNMLLHVVNRDEKLNIGACAVLTEDNTTDDTLKSFENCIPELTNEQRIVKFIFFDLIETVKTDLKRLIWNRL